MDWSSGATTFWDLRRSYSSPAFRSSPGPLTFRPPTTSARLDDELTALDLLAESVDKSLVTAAPAGSRTSYRLLETMRQYGEAQLTGDETDILQRSSAQRLLRRSLRALVGWHSG